MYKRQRGWKQRSWKRKTPHRPWYFYAALWVGIPIGLELLMRLGVSVTGMNQAFATQPSEQAQRVQAYQLGFRSPSGEPYPELPQQGALQAIRSPLMGYQLLPAQQNPYWIINPQGFRDEEPIELAKASNEVRIFVLGGGMAFGQLNANNQATFAHQLEQQLNAQVTAQRQTPEKFQPTVLPYTAEEVEKVLQRPERIPERQYRVVNAAVPGHASGNDLAMLIQQVAAYNPDMVILLNSYEDLLLPSTYSGSDIPGLDALLTGNRDRSDHQLGQTLQSWLGQLYLVKGVQTYLLPARSPATEQVIPLNLTMATQPTLEEYLPTDEAELNARVDRYRNHLLQMVRWSASARKRLLVGIQPELSARSPDAMPPAEQALLEQLGDDYATRIEAGYNKLVAAAKQATQTSANAELLDLHQLFANSQDPAFQSPTSLTDEANAVLAEQFYQVIIDQLAITPKPFGS
ncbi:MAG: SGNH/GDSL hydrolase family protein [Elainella sp. Prado103]|jgi:hypothetical protein|nr:SGNH/GDSL hydrolase family protein [Elainella sp. Prado103]